MDILAGLAEVNYIGALVATIAAFVFGSLWYSPLLFGKRWQKMVGMTPEQMKSQMGFAMVHGFVMTFVGAVIMSLFTGGAGLSQGMQVGFLIGLLIATSMLGGATYEGKSATYKLISAGYILLVWTLVGGIVGYM